jgi:hypothetical protein
LSQRHQPAPASAAAASTPSSKRSSWWNAWNTPETSFGCAANASSGDDDSGGAVCSAASALAAGRLRGDDDDDASERTARLCGARAAPRKGYAAHWPAPSARRHLLSTDGASSVTQKLQSARSTGTTPVGSSTNSGGNGTPIGVRWTSVVRGSSRVFAASSPGTAGALVVTTGSVVTPGSGAAGAAAAASTGSVDGAPARGAPRAWAASTRGTCISRRIGPRRRGRRPPGRAP